MKPRLELKLLDEMGRTVAVTCYEVERREIPVDVPRPCELTDSFGELIYKMKERTFRTEIFERVGGKLGKMMAVRMDDKEGWNGKERMLK